MRHSRKLASSTIQRAQLRQKPLQSLRTCCSKLQPFLRNRMQECQHDSVEREALGDDRLLSSRPPVSPVADDRMAKRCHVDPDLVRSAGFELQLQAGEMRKALEDAVVRDGALAL